MLAKVELLYGDKVHTRILGNCKFTPLSLWGPFKGVILFLAHEENYRNADPRYKFRSIFLLVSPSHIRRVSCTRRKGRQTIACMTKFIAASKMTGLPVNDSNFRRKEWQKVVSHPLSAMALRESNLASRALPHSGPEVDSEGKRYDSVVFEETRQKRKKRRLLKIMRYDLYSKCWL